LRKDKLFFPVDPSTASRATIGGMTANNSCGSRSLRYGNMVHNVRGVDALLADGTTAWFGEVPGNFDDNATFERYRELVTRMRALHRREAEEIERRFPKVLRRVGGYNIDSISNSGHNMARMLVGSEGTLAFFNEIELELQPIPAHRVLGICHFPSFYGAMAATRRIVELGPSAVELVDRTMIDLSRDIPMFRPVVERFVRGEPAALLLTEFAGDDAPENLRRLRALVELMGDLGFPRRRRRGDRPRLPAGGLGDPRAGPEHHDVDEGRREAGLVSRGLRRTARGPRRLHRPPDAHLREARHLWHLVTRMPRSAVCTSGRCSI